MATIEIDGQSYTVENGKMIIEVTDELGIHVPRFCYHKKLSVAANCRMCLVQIEKSKKPVPACATPITDGMKIFTRSEEALRSQQAVMEFLLINHPLDCPVCDQGGECELQDVSMGYGASESDYQEEKRAVKDDDLGSLISTEMTRCIQCTRCVRFGEEVAGVRELGATGRGEHMQIGTYVQHAMTSEVSGNIIDLCPVGALTSKPYRFTARAWELSQHHSVAPHDCLGSALNIHVRSQEVMRVVPRENEALNETWLSDRDRFSYLGLKNASRLASPKIKQKGQWKTVDWQTALTFAAEEMARCINKHGADQFAAFASPSSTLEEMYLLQRMMRSLGVSNLDARLQQSDFRDQAHQATLPESTLNYAELEKQQRIVLFGTHLHREVPLAALRVRKAFLAGAEVYAVNPVDYDFPFTLTDKAIAYPHEMMLTLARVLLALVDDIRVLPADVQKWLLGLKADPFALKLAEALKKDDAVMVTGMIAENHPDASILRTLLHFIAMHSKAKVLRLTLGANTAGAWLAGMLPHREALGKAVSEPGLDVQRALEARLKGYCLLAVDAEYDFANAYRTRQSLLAAECVLVLTAFDTPAIEEYATVMLPIAPYAETPGTYVNVNQQWQTLKPAVLPFADARPAWKVIRVLANLMNVNGFDYLSAEDVLAEIEAGFKAMPVESYHPYAESPLPEPISGLVRVGEWPLYRVDSIVRHATALQKSGSADRICVRMHPATAAQKGLSEKVTISQEEIAITLPLEHDERVAKDVVWVLSAMPETVDLGQPFGEIQVV